MHVDWARLNSFIAEGDEEEMRWLREMIQTLIINYEERLVELDEIIKNPDNAKLIALLHQMKGVTSNFGLETLRKITSEAENLAKANNLQSALAETTKFPLAWKETKAELKTKLGI